MDKIKTFLTGLGLEKYIKNFEEHEIKDLQLSTLTETEVCTIVDNRIGPKKAIYEAICQLRNNNGDGEVLQVVPDPAPSGVQPQPILKSESSSSSLGCSNTNKSALTIIPIPIASASAGLVNSANNQVIEIGKKEVENKPKLGDGDGFKYCPRLPPPPPVGVQIQRSNKIKYKGSFISTLPVQLSTSFKCYLCHLVWKSIPELNVHLNGNCGARIKGKYIFSSDVKECKLCWQKFDQISSFDFFGHVVRCFDANTKGKSGLKRYHFESSSSSSDEDSADDDIIENFKPILIKKKNILAIAKLPEDVFLKHMEKQINPKKKQVIIKPLQTKNNSVLGEGRCIKPRFNQNSGLNCRTDNEMPLLTPQVPTPTEPSIIFKCCMCNEIMKSYEEFNSHLDAKCGQHLKGDYVFNSSKKECLICTLSFDKVQPFIFINHIKKCAETRKVKEEKENRKSETDESSSTSSSDGENESEYCIPVSVPAMVPLNVTKDGQDDSRSTNVFITGRQNKEKPIEPEVTVEVDRDLHRNKPYINQKAQSENGENLKNPNCIEIISLPTTKNPDGTATEDQNKVQRSQKRSQLSQESNAQDNNNVQEVPVIEGNALISANYTISSTNYNFQQNQNQYESQPEEEESSCESIEAQLDALLNDGNGNEENHLSYRTRAQICNVCKEGFMLESNYRGHICTEF